VGHLIKYPLVPGRFNTLRPRGVLVLSGFHKFVKKKYIGGIGFRFVPSDSSMLVDSVTLFTFYQGGYMVILDSSERAVAQQTVWTFD
jgi:hypothetical protein